MQLLLRDRSSGGRRGIQRTGSDPDKGGPKSRSRHGNNHWEIPAFFYNFFVLSFWNNILAITSFDMYKMAFLKMLQHYCCFWENVAVHCRCASCACECRSAFKRYLCFYRPFTIGVIRLPAHSAPDAWVAVTNYDIM